MIELKGKYNTAVVYTDNVENSTIGQLIALLNQESVANSKIRIMPDCHTGAGCTIGTTMQLQDKVIPNLVGSDIGCGMLVIKLKENRVDLPNIDSIIKTYIPSGGSVNDEPKKFQTSLDVEQLACYRKPGAKIRPILAYQSVGTLGGGNHFIEIDKDNAGNLYLVIHTGSRHIGIEVCNYYQNIGYEKIKETCNGVKYKDKCDELIAKLKSENRLREINVELAKFRKAYIEDKPNIPFELAYIEGQDFNNYIHDMNMIQKHASCNRREIARLILKYAKLHEESSFETVHNYIDTQKMILRKGAVSAALGEKIIIPMNMRDGSLICIGKGNDDWNQSAPHGAGRLMSRSQAKQSFTVSEFKKTMDEAGIYSTSVNKSTLDESPMAYKPMQEILDNITDTVDVISIIKPIYNFKAGEAE